ncbi:hypothetical protein FNJ84_07385 [Paracoccus sp. M683]|uniref:hypothetical protein n=1 Tax=Paracoccus sp. M683 TaxID=2594268 RepID=UPI00117E167A|nr:hypothetical protein [Paracoccus sp. M683]TRW97333.1 hypothetical protein FNJ84_07385 [Paracoccus sp. M683]
MPRTNCARNCWIAGGAIGLLVWIFASGIGQTSFMGGLFLGLIAAVLMGLFLTWALCSGTGSAEDERDHALPRATPSQQPGAMPAAVPAAAAPLMASADPVAAAEPAPAQMPEPAPVAQPAAASDTARNAAKAARDSRKRTEKAEKAALDAAQASEEVVKTKRGKRHSTLSLASTASEVSGKKATEKAKAEADAGDGKAAKKVEKKAAKKAGAAETPATIEADDLKQIKGVGPKLEALLHDNGVTRFAQIAAWTDAEVDRFADLIGSMGGRIRSDDWIGQARTLASGGETEFSQRVEKGDVY